MIFGMKCKLQTSVKWRMHIFLAFIFSFHFAQAQTKRFNLQTTLPSSLTVCGKADSMVFEIRNISASGISNILLTLKLPVGAYYVNSSFNGAGVSESNIANLNSPVFKLSNFTLAGYLRFSVKITSTCDLQAFVSKGSPAITSLDFTYTGGNESHQTSSVNVSTPNILLNTITNQVKNAYINDLFIREISIKNTGKGGAFTFTFYRTNGNGLKVNSSRSRDKYSKDSIISVLDSNDFKLLGNKDGFFDANEELKIYDTVRVIKCTNLISVYNTKFGCGNTMCNLSTKNAIVNLDPFIKGLTIIPTSTIDWCFDINKPTNNSILVINKSNKPILNTEVNILQSYNGGFYNYQMSAIDTTGMIVRKGKRGPIISKNFTKFLYNFTGSYFSCLGTSPIGGFSLGLGNMNVNDTFYITWKTISCVPDICNTTLTANRWRFSATYLDQCGTLNTLTEDWGSGGGIQYASAIPWTPTDIIAGVPDILNYNITSLSLFPTSARARYAVKLTLQAGIKHSLKPDDIKFSDLNGTDWKPYVVKVVGSDIIAYFNRLTINLLKADLNIVIEADCKVSNANGLKNYTVNILYSTDSSCSNGTDFQLYCNTGQVKVHCTKSCVNGGMLFKSFVVKRKNYGKPDNNNDGEPDGSGTLNMARVKTNSSLLYDTISAFYSGIVRSSGSTNIFFNGRIRSKLSNGHLLKPIGATLNIYRSGKLRYSCNKMPYSSNLAGSIMTCEVDLNLNSAKLAGCGKISDYFFLSTDSVVVNLNFVYATNIGSYSGEIFFDNSEFYLSTTANPSSSQKLQCDTLSGRHILLGSFFTNWYTENYISNSCSPTTLYNSFYFSAGNCCNNYAGGNPFPFEYRPFNYLEKLKISLPKGYVFSSAAIYYYKSAGHSNYTSHYASNLKPLIKSQDTLIFNFDTLFNATKGIFKRSEEGYQGTFVLNIIPTCKVSVNTNELVGYSSYFHWPTANATEINSAYPDSIKFVHPTVLMNAINSVSVSKKDTFSWDIILSNTQNGSSIDNVWMANSTAQKVKIISVKDLSTGKDLPVKNGIFKAGSLNSTSSRTFRVNAISSNCRLDSFKLALGWNCDTYPDSLDVYPCKNLMNYINLILSPEPPLIISTLLEDTARTDVCTNRKFQAIIANVDEDNIYHLKLRVTIPQGMTFVDTGLYYSFPYNSTFRKLGKPILVSGTTYEWSLSDSISDLKNGLERVSDTLKSKIKVQFFLESNCQITAGAFVSIMPDGRIGCGEPVKRVGYTGQPIKIKGVDNPYFTLVTMSPDSINLCNPNVAFKAKVIYLGPTKTLANDSIVLSLPLGFEPDTTSLSTIRIAGSSVRNVNQQMIWSFAIPKGLFPGDSSMLDFKLKITNKAPSCGLEPFTLQSVTKKKAYCVKIQDSCEINVATGSFYKALKLDRANPVIKLIYSKSVNAGDSGEIADIAFSVTNTSKTIDTGFSTRFRLIIDKNSNGKYDAGETNVQQFTKSKGWLSKQIVIFNYKGFVKNTDICKLLIVSDSTNCQCLKYSLPILNLQLKNAGRDTSFCSNYQSSIGLDSVKNYKYEWLPSDYLSTPNKSRTVYKKPNNTNKDDTRNYLLKTSRPGGCISTDTVIIKGKSFISMPKLKDTVAICLGSSTPIGDTARGGKAPLNFRWTPTSGLSSSVQMVVKANPKVSTKYYMTVNDQNNCSIRDSTFVNVARPPKVKIGYIGNCEKKDVQFLDNSDYFGQPKGSTMWRIDFNNISQIDPVFVFDTIGYFFSRLVVSNKYGCSDSNYAYIRINGNPNVFNTKTNQCLGDSIQFKDQSWVARMNIKSIQWAFTNDTLSGNKAAKQFNKAGIYHFKHIVTSDSGCVSSLSDSVLIIDRPKAGFSKKGTCDYDSILFTNLSIPGKSDSLISFSWLLANQTIAKDQFKFKFDSAGTYSLSLRVSSKNGCNDTVNSSIKISPKPKALFTVTNQCVYDSVRVTNQSSIKTGKIQKFQWIIPSIYSNQTNNPVIGKLPEGKYILKLSVISDSLCLDSSETPFEVYPSIRPKIAFTPACENENMRISDISNQTTTKINTRLWTLGSSQYTDSSFFIGLSSKGNYPIHLDIITKEACSFSLDTTYEVFENPKADFTSISDCNDAIVRFADISTPGSKANLTSRLWFENTTQIFSGNNFSTKFPTSGSHQISLRVINSLGCKDSVIKTLIVSPMNYADFTFNDACPEDTVKLSFTGFTGTNTLKTLDLSWGDGTKSNNLPAKHTYSSSGNYTIRLSAQTDKGCVIDTFKTLKIHPKPESKFDYYPPFPDIKNPGITITDRSVGANKWNYTFGDGGTSVIQNPIYNYKDSGAYFIRQNVENQFGCKDSSYKRLYVNFILFTHIPNAFSPGMDDINPLFQPIGLGIKDFKLIIFNRWGEKVFDPGWGRKAWDGNYLGEYVQQGIYPYYIEILDFGNKRYSYNGVVNVIR